MGSNGNFATTRPSKMEENVLNNAVKTKPIAITDFILNIDLKIIVKTVFSINA